LRGKLDHHTFEAARVCVNMITERAQTVVSSAERHATLLATRKLLPRYRRGEAERFCLGVQLLLLVLLVKITELPASRVSAGAGFQSADSARKSFKELTALTLTAVKESPSTLQDSLHILIDLIAGSRSRLQPPRSNDEHGATERQRDRETERRRDGETERRRDGETEGRRDGG
jgi:hypothetical protein